MCVLIYFLLTSLSSQPAAPTVFARRLRPRTRPKVGALTFHPLARHLIRTHTTLLLPSCHVVRPSAPPRHHSLSPTSRCAELAIFSKSPINTAKRWANIVEHAESSRLKACDAGSFRSFVVLLRAGCRNVQGPRGRPDWIIRRGSICKLADPHSPQREAARESKGAVGAASDSADVVMINDGSGAALRREESVVVGCRGIALKANPHNSHAVLSAAYGAAETHEVWRDFEVGVVKVV